MSVYMLQPPDRLGMFAQAANLMLAVDNQQMKREQHEADQALQPIRIATAQSNQQAAELQQQRNEYDFAEWKDNATARAQMLKDRLNSSELQLLNEQLDLEMRQDEQKNGDALLAEGKLFFSTGPYKELERMALELGNMPATTPGELRNKAIRANEFRNKWLASGASQLMNQIGANPYARGRMPSGFVDYGAQVAGMVQGDGALVQALTQLETLDAQQKLKGISVQTNDLSKRIRDNTRNRSASYQAMREGSPEYNRETLFGEYAVLLREEREHVRRGRSQGESGVADFFIATEAEKTGNAMDAAMSVLDAGQVKVKRRGKDQYVLLEDLRDSDEIVINAAGRDAALKLSSNGKTVRQTAEDLIRNAAMAYNAFDEDLTDEQASLTGEEVRKLNPFWRMEGELFGLVDSVSFNSELPKERRIERDRRKSTFEDQLEYEDLLDQQEAINAQLGAAQGTGPDLGLFQ